MADRDARTPKVFLARHGETEWAKDGRYTGTTDIALTPAGEQQVTSAARALVGPGKMLDPARLVHVIVSPRVRARRTLELLDTGFAAPEISEDIAEWDYGDYEGLKVDAIRALRQERGLDAVRAWDIWADGCEGGESAAQVTQRIDRLIAHIKALQAPHMDDAVSAASGDVLVVAHGLILRCFVKRWLGFALDFPLQMILPPGAISVMSYKNGRLEQPCFYVGLSVT